MTINKIICGTSTGSELADSINATINSSAISNRVAVVGTSLMEQMTDFGGGRVRYTNRSWLYLAQAMTFQSFQSPCWQDEFDDPFLGDRGFWGFNYGSGGAGIQEIIDAANNVILADLITAKVNYVIVDGGTNDIANLSITAEEIHDKRVELFSIFANKGIKVIALTILTSGTTRWPNGELREKAAQVNAMSREWIKTVEGVYLLDWNEDYMDFSNINGIPIDGYSIDNVHFSFQGAFAVAQQLASFMNTLLPSTDKGYSSPDDVYDSTDNVTGNFWPNPYFFGTGGTLDGADVTGTVADQLELERQSGTAPLIASLEAGEKGVKQVITITPTGDTTLFHLKPSGATFKLHDGGLAGEWVIMEFDVELSDYSEWESFMLFMLSDGTDAMQVASIGREPGQYLNGSFIGRLQTPPLLLASDSTGIRVRFEGSIGGAAGTPVIKLSAGNIRKITDPRISYGIGHS